MKRQRCKCGRATRMPSAIRWKGAWHPIERIALSWQLDVNWWRARIYRDYYKVHGRRHGPGDLSRPADR